LIFSKQFGLAIAISKQFSSSVMLSPDDFLSCKLASWVSMNYYPVENVENTCLMYKYICISPVQSKPELVPTRVLLNKYIQAQVNCNFSTILQVENEPSKSYIVTAFGPTLIDDQTVDRKELIGKTLPLWITHIQLKFGCYWSISNSNQNKTLEKINQGAAPEVIASSSNVKDTLFLLNSHDPLMSASSNSNNNDTGRVAHTNSRRFLDEYTQFVYGSEVGNDNECNQFECESFGSGSEGDTASFVVVRTPSQCHSSRTDLDSQHSTTSSNVPTDVIVNL